MIKSLVIKAIYAIMALIKTTPYLVMKFAMGTRQIKGFISYVVSVVKWKK